MAFVAAAFVAGAVLSGAGAVWASHQFPDVPTSNPFHDDIDWMVDNGITTGYPDGTFRPNRDVQRQELSAFLHRYNGSIELAGASTNPPAGTTFPLNIPCPAGKRAVAGGALASATVPASLGLALTRSNPDLGGAGWQIRFDSISGATVDPEFIQGYVTCVPR